MKEQGWTQGSQSGSPRISSGERYWRLPEESGKETEGKSMVLMGGCRRCRKTRTTLAFLVQTS